jgi:acyl-CoA thioesterase-2
MLEQLLDLEAIDSQRFTTRNHQESFRKTIFGGQVLAQALMAAGRTVRNRPVHSLHAYFLRAGSVDSPVEYWVENLRDGNSVSSRSVRAVQEGELIFTMQASFHKHESGFEHQAYAPTEALPPETLREQFADANGNLAREFEHLGVAPIDFVPYSRDIFEPQASESHSAQFWVRCRENLPADPLVHYCALAFASDLGLLATSLMPHPTSLFNGEVFPASMDHSIWFHRPPTFNDWHHYLTDSPWAGGGRGFCRGTLYDQQQRIVASVCQEGMIRPRR